MTWNMNRWLDELRASAVKKPLPVLSFPGIRIIGTTVRKLVTNGEVQADCMKAIADRYGTAAAVSNMDLSVEAEAFGAKVVFSDNEVPTVTGRLLETEADIDDLTVPPVTAARAGEYVKAIEKAASSITDRPVLAGVIGPFSLAGRLMEMTEVMIKCMTEPNLVHRVLRKSAEFLTAYITAFKNAGASGIVMAEPAAGLLSPNLCSEFSSAYIRGIIESVEDENFLVVYHNCGNTVPLIDAVLETGARAIHLGNTIDLSAVIDKYPADRIIMGNLDPVEVLRSGSPESVAVATEELLDRMGGYPNWVISSGCDIPPLTPLAAIDTFFETVEKYYAGAASAKTG